MSVVCAPDANRVGFEVLTICITEGFSADYDTPTSESWKPFQRVQQYAIPDRIFDQINQAQLNYQIGLFASLNHAWITIDNALYLWDYTHPNPEIIGFEDQPNAITHVKLVKPRPGVFVASISQLLVVATASDIHLIGVAEQSGPEGVHKVSLYQTRMQVSIKGINVTCIEGSTASGRIFFGGSSSNDIYELTYQQEEKWFANKCGKICHTSKGLASILPALPFTQTAPQEHVKQMVADDSRNLLYVLSSKSTIRVFHMRSANNLPFVLDRTLGQLRTMISHIVAQSQLLQPNTSIVSISPIAGNEAARVALLATTSTGIRIYLSSTSGGYYQNYSTTAPPTSMQVQHVRFPPPLHNVQQAAGHTPASQALAYRNSPAIDINAPTLSPSYSAVRYAPGYFICVKKGPDQSGNQDRLFVITPDSGRIAQSTDQNQVTRFLETVWSDTLDGPVQGEQGVGLITPVFAAASTPSGFGNELAVQFDKPASQFAILTNRGIHIIRRRRLVDIFADSVRSIADESFEDATKRFIKSYGRVETCATALAVACCEATSVTADARITSINDRDVTESAARVFKEHGGKPTFDENLIFDNGASADNVRLSPRHDGLALFISRLVRSVWHAPILKVASKPVGGLTVSPGVPLNKLRDVQQALERLHKFLNDNKTTIDGLTGPDTVARAVSRNDELAQQAEHRAMHALLKLIGNIIEGIAFVLVLFEERVDEILLSFPESGPVRGQTQQLTFEGLFCSSEGKNLAKELVKAIVNLNIANGSNVETVAGALQRKCGSFCSPEDVIIFKAQEQLNKALEAGANSESARVLLNESLKLFQKVAKHLSMEHLQGAIGQFVNMAFYAGAIRLVLEVAQEKDRGNRALSWINDGMPAGDVRESAFNERTQCYGLIHAVINAVDQASAQDPSGSDPVTSITGRRRAEAYEEINNSNDEVFQTHLYDWYLSQGWSERLLEISSPYVIKYLTRRSEGDIAHADLLWKYYARYHDYLGAAKVQLDLAKSTFDVKLDKRIEYLSRAKTNASTRVGGMGQVERSRQSRQELLREISDLLDLATIQEELLQRLKSDRRLSDERKAAVLSELNGQILPLDEVSDYSIRIFIFDTNTTVAVQWLCRPGRVSRPLPSDLSSSGPSYCTGYRLHVV